MEAAKFDIVVSMTKEKKSLRVILKALGVSESYYYTHITDEQKELVKSIRNRFITALDEDYVFTKYMTGVSCAELAQDLRVSTTRISKIIDKHLDHLRLTKKNDSSSTKAIVTDNMKHYRDELINYMLSPEGISLNKDKTLKMIQEVKNLNKYLDSL